MQANLVFSTFLDLFCVDHGSEKVNANDTKKLITLQMEEKTIEKHECVQ